MDQKGTNPYSTEIPVAEAEAEIAQAPSAASHEATPSVTVTPPLPGSLAPQPTAAPPPPPIAPEPKPRSMPPPPPKKSSLLPKVIIGILLLMILGLSVYIVSVKMANQKAAREMAAVPTKAVPTPTAIPTATPIPVQNEASTSADPTSNRFYSKELGIMFDTAKFLPSDKSKAVLTQTVGNRVFIYKAGEDPLNRRYIDVLSKLTTDTTLQAAQKVTSGDPSYKECTFNITKNTIYPTSYEKITVNCSPNDGWTPEFFLTDSMHPDKLLYVSKSEGAIPAATDNWNLSWQETLRFL